MNQTKNKSKKMQQTVQKIIIKKDQNQTYKTLFNIESNIRLYLQYVIIANSLLLGLVLAKKYIPNVKQKNKGKQPLESPIITRMILHNVNTSH
jgi:hypothetical protein